MKHDSSLNQRGRILILTLMVTVLYGWTVSGASAHNNDVGSEPKEGAVFSERLQRSSLGAAASGQKRVAWHFADRLSPAAPIVRAAR